MYAWAMNVISTVPRKFDEAEPLLDDFIKNHPLYSEAHRIKAQMEMTKGNIDKAIDIDIEALRCNPQNGWALLLMGNLYSKYKNDFDVAKKYYDSVLKYTPVRDKKDVK